MNNISSKLENLAAVASISPKRLKQSIPSEWVPSRNGPGLPNINYTKTREERWATLSILVARIICDYTINPEDIRQLAKMFTDTTDTADKAGSDWRSNTTQGWKKEFGISVQAITKWCRDGEEWIRKEKHGRYKIDIKAPFISSEGWKKRK